MVQKDTIYQNEGVVYYVFGRFVQNMFQYKGAIFS